MHFVNDVHFVFAHGGGVLGVFQHFAYVVYACVAGGIDFQQIHKSPCINVAARLAHATGFTVIGVSQLRLLAKMRAMVVLPTPRVPVSK